MDDVDDDDSDDDDGEIPVPAISPAWGDEGEREESSKKNLVIYNGWSSEIEEGGSGGY